MRILRERIIKSAVSLILFLSILSGYSAASAERMHQQCMMPAKIKIVKLDDGIFYPVITGGVEKPAVQESINRVFLQHAKKVQQLDKKYKKQYEHDQFISAAGPYYANTKPFIRFNQRCRLSVSFVDESYTGGAHGMHLETVYNFNLRTGKRYILSDVIRSKKELNKVNDYLKKQMADLKKQGRYDFFDNTFKSIDLKKNQFYFVDRGIVIVFQEYEVAPYSNGIIHLEVPFRVFKTPRLHPHHHHERGQSPGAPQNVKMRAE